MLISFLRSPTPSSRLPGHSWRPGWRVPVLLLSCLLLASPPLSASQSPCRADQSESSRRMQAATGWVDATLAGCYGSHSPFTFRQLSMGMDRHAVHRWWDSHLGRSPSRHVFLISRLTPGSRAHDRCSRPLAGTPFPFPFLQSML